MRHDRLGSVASASLLQSKGVVVLYATIAATIAAVLLFTLFDEEAQAAQSKVEAETMTLSGSAVVVHSSSTASDGKDVAFYTNGSASRSFSGAATNVSLRARGQACQGNPRLKVYVDGALKGTVDLSSSTFADYSVGLSGLSTGTHTLRISFENDYYLSSTCDRNVYLDYYVLTVPDVTPPSTCAKGTFLAEYRNELRTFNTQPVLSRCESAIDYDWGSGSPGSGVNANSFTARWVGNFDFEASDYEFTATSDDGVRLWVDGQLLIDQWKDQGATTYKATKTMTAGSHEVKVEYYEYGGLAVAKASWAKVASSPPPSGTDPVMVGAGDIARCSSLSGAEATAKLLDAIPGTVYTLGDNAYEAGTANEFANCYDPTWGRHKARTRPAPGNHEYYTAGASGYFGYFGSAAGDPQRGYYSYDLGEWHVVVLNSNDRCRYVSCAASSAQAEWLRADLAANPARCTLAYFHHPLFTSGNYSPGFSEVRPLWETLYSGGAEVVLNGHDHLYERFAPQSPSGAPDPARGIREFVVGTGGAERYGIKTVHPNSQVRNTNTFGVLKLTLHASSYDWQFVPEAGKTFTDSGTTSCH